MIALVSFRGVDNLIVHNAGIHITVVIVEKDKALEITLESRGNIVSRTEEIPFLETHLLLEVLRRKGIVAYEVYVGNLILLAFINRIDDIIVFNALKLDQIVGIVKIQIDNLNERLKRQNVRVELTKKAYEKLADLAYDPSYGARPLRRIVTQRIENPLARAILSGKLKEGGVMKFTEKELSSEGDPEID